MSQTRSATNDQSMPTCSNTENLSSTMDTLMSKYLKALQEEIASNEKEQDKLNAEITTIHDLMGHLLILSERPEWPDSFIQVNSLAYFPAAIAHTGEHYVKLGPEIYSLMSLKETLAFLQRKIDRLQDVLHSFQIQHQQLEDRCRLSLETTESADGTEDMPNAITSDQGTAHKTNAGFYEVIEPFVEGHERAFYKRRKNKSKKKESNQDSSLAAGDCFRRLDELQKQEDLRKEMVHTENFEKWAIDVSERVKTVLRDCGVYKNLLEDDVIQYHCGNVGIQGKTSVTAVLNELIVKTLIKEPVDSFNNRADSKTDKCRNNASSSNDLIVSTFLDDIEKDMEDWNI